MRFRSTLANMDAPAALAEVLAAQAGVLTTAEALTHMSPKALRCQLAANRWQSPCRGIVVASNGALSWEQRLWVATKAGGRGAAAFGFTAAQLGGLKGFESETIFVKSPHERTEHVVEGVHFRTARTLAGNVHPVLAPPRTRMPVALVESAELSKGNPRRASAVLIAGVQQRLARVDAIRTALIARGGMPNRRLLLDVLGDVEGGAHALPERDFLQLLRRHRLPRPDQQSTRLDSRGRRRWLDARWDKYRLTAEIDGRGHLDVLTQWDDSDRDNEVTLDGERVLRFPSLVVRLREKRVAEQIARGLRLGGWSRG